MLVSAIEDARRRTLQLVEDLSDEQLLGPQLDVVNPLLWEIGHVAWFQEKWALRHACGRPPLRADADALYDSAAIPHDVRWGLPLLERQATLVYMHAVLQDVLEVVEQGPPSDQLIYFVRLALFHEDMHAEAFVMSRQTLGYPAPCFAQLDRGNGAGPCPGDAEIAGGEYHLGAFPGQQPFIFDNEKWAHPVTLAPFALSRAVVTQEEFLAFVEDGGYRCQQWWSPAGWQWRQQVAAEHPLHWQRQRPGVWQQRVFDTWLPLQPHQPMTHISCYEAEAYCRSQGRRLPTEPEWEAAATGFPSQRTRFPWGEESPAPQHASLDGAAGGLIDVGERSAGDSVGGCRQMIGNVWEWTQSDFLPYPGFVVDPYREYSQPWFGTHTVLRGGSWLSRGRMLRNSFRNFYRPGRRDVFAGFRTCISRS